jgi:hypothetical protein
MSCRPVPTRSSSRGNHGLVTARPSSADQSKKGKRRAEEAIKLRFPKPSGEGTAFLRRFGEGQEELYRRGGVAAAMKKMVELSGVRFEDREPDVVIPQPDGQQAARMAANMNFFLSHDAPAAHRYRFDMTALEAARMRILPAVGRTSGSAVPRYSVQAVAERLALQVVEFPGGHSGYALRPREFALRLRQVLNSSRETDRENLQASGV